MEIVKKLECLFDHILVINLDQRLGNIFQIEQK